MSFLRRISNAAAHVLPSIPSSHGVTPSHVPRRATETFRATPGLHLTQLKEDSDSEIESRASWELSDAESVGSSSSSLESGKTGLTGQQRRSKNKNRRRGSGGSDSVGSHGGSSSEEEEDSDTSTDSDSELEEDGRQRDRFDMMTRHLWNVAERQGWFRDAHSDGLVSLR